jgi:hypothetical protein
MTVLRLALRFLRWEYRTALALALVAFVPAAAYGACVSIESSYRAAVAAGVEGDMGHFSYQLSDPRPDSELPAQLAARADMVGLDTVPRNIATWAEDAVVPADVTTASGGSGAAIQFGVLIAGANAAHENDLVVSKAVAEQLGVGLGDRVRVLGSGTDRQPPGEGVVTGIAVTPTRPGDLSVYRRIARPTGTATRWITDTNPFADPALGDLTRSRVVGVRSAGGIIADGVDAASSTVLSAVGFLPPFIILLAVALEVALVASLRRRFLPTVDALAAAGGRPRRDWRVPTAATGAAILVGTLLGIAGSLLGTRLLAQPVAGVFAQHWVDAVSPWGSAVLYLLGMVTVPTLLAYAVLRFADRTPGSPTGNRRRFAVLGGAAVLLGAGLVAVPAGAGPISVALSLCGGALIALGSTTVISTVRRRRERAAARMVGEYRATLGLTAVMVAVSVFFASWFSAHLQHSGVVGQEYLAEMQPAGSYLLTGVGNDDVRVIMDRYRGHGGSPVAFDDPQETASGVRVAVPGVPECAGKLTPATIQSVSAECPLGDSLTPITTVRLADDLTALDPAVSSGTMMLADSSLVADGKVSVLKVANDGTIQEAVTVAAVPVRGLGGDLPGALMSWKHPMVASLGLRPAGTATVMLKDFAALDGRAQARMRATIARSAGYALGHEDTGSAASRSSVLSTLVSGAGSIVVLTLIAAAGSAFIAGQRRPRELIVAMGVTRMRRIRLGLTCFAIVAAGGSVGALTGLIAAWDAGSAIDGNYGVGWAWPGIAALVGAGLCGTYYGSGRGLVESGRG